MSSNNNPNEWNTILSLLSLLDDEDENVAINAMAELLNREDELGNSLAILQEANNPLARRRAHQLQAAITLRRRRRAFLHALRSPQVDLGAGLVEVHLQWFDNDSRPALYRLVSEFRLEAERSPRKTLADLSALMKKFNFIAQQENTLHPEDYCIGPTLENHRGAASLLCGILLLIADPSLKLRLVRLMGEFVLYDGAQLLRPLQDWQGAASPGMDHAEFWDARMLLRFASTNLFSAAVNSDSFRYVLTIAQALSGAADDEPLDYLPYPYYPADDEDDAAENGKKTEETL